jgi:hypothetical protein
MIESIFRLCVFVLMQLAYVLGTTYEAVNVWIFVILWPIFTLALVGIVIWQGFRIRAMANRSQADEPKTNRLARRIRFAR